ncbi:MAG: hypothetical protein J2P26_10800 [Nocardiopsaceae bacterium]|nr:hypothetical protein [Nocardiopsaceae bacterium]
MTGRPVREPGRRGERYREARERRARGSRARRQAYWAGRIAAAATPLQLFRVVADKLSTAVVQRERRAAVEYDRARQARDARQEAAAKAQLDKVRAEIAADLAAVTDTLAALADKHETPRV